MNGQGGALSTVAGLVVPRVAQALRGVSEAVPLVRAATVLSDFAALGATVVAFDTAPETPALARSVGGLFARGTRVVCLLYPPHGVLVLGAMPSKGNAELVLDRLRLRGTGDVSVSSVLHALQIGLSNGLNMAFDNNEIMARNNGVAAVLNLNNDGGLVHAGVGGFATEGKVTADGGLESDLMTGVWEALNTDSTTSTTYVTTVCADTVPAVPSGAYWIFVSGTQRNTSAGASSRLSWEVRETDGSGTQIVAPNDNFATQNTTTSFICCAVGRRMGGFPTTGDIFVRVMKRCSSGTAEFQDINLTVIPVP